MNRFLLYWEAFKKALSLWLAVRKASRKLNQDIEQVKKEPLQKLDQEKRCRIKLVVAQFLYCDDCRISNNIRRDEIERRALDFYENRAEFNARVNTLSYQIFEALGIPSGDPEIQFKGFDLSKY